MTTSTASSTGRVTVNAEKLQELRKQVIYTKQVIDPQRINIMAESYKQSTGQPNVIRRARFFADLLDKKKLYIDDNLFVGSLASQPNAIYTYPEFGTSWMLDKTVVDHLSPEDAATNAEVKKYWDDRSLSKRTYEVFEKKFGFDYKPVNDAGLTAEFISWPGGGGNLDYPKVYNEGLASMIKDCEDRQAALDMRLPNASKLYFLEAVLITLKSIVRLSHRYAALAKDMAAKEKNAVRKQELLDMAEVCERVPEHPARNYREALHCHFFMHICCELEQVGCGYSEAYLGRGLDPFYQKDKAAGLIGPEEATYLLKLMFCKLNEISYYYGQDVSTLNSNDTGQTISLGGWSPDGLDGTPEMDYIICDAVIQNKLPVPPLSLMYHDKLSGKFLDKCLEVTAAGWGMPQFINADNMVVRSLNAYPGITLQEARGSCGFACVATAPPHQTGHPVEGEINIAKSFELALNDGFDPRTKKQVGPKTGDPEKFKDFEELYEAFRLQNDFGMVTIRRMGFVGMMINAEVLPVPLRSALTGGCIESGTDVWSGGARWYCPTLITTAGIDAVNSLMAVKKLVFEDKKLTMAELRKALAADFVGYENIQKMCIAAPKHGNDIDEVNKLVRRVYDDTNDSFQKVGGNFLSADIKTNIDHY
jgi:formate C-acetyltransferase